MSPEETAFQQIVAYCKAIGKPVTKERDGWSTTEDDVRRYVSGFKKEEAFAEDKFLEDFRNTINSNLDNGLEHADAPFALNGILHSAKTLRTAVMYGQSLVDVDGLAARVAERTCRWLAETSYDRMKSFDLEPLANHLRELLGDAEAVRKFDEQALVYFKIPMNEALELNDFESLESKGTNTFRSVMGRFHGILRNSPAAQSISLEEYLSTGLRNDVEIVGGILPELQEIRNAEGDHLAYIEGSKLVGNETAEMWMDLYEREKGSTERLQRFITCYDSLRKVVTKLKNCFSPKFEDEAVLADVYKSVDINDERFTFSFGQPPLLERLREAENTIEDIKGLYKKKIHKTVLYQWFDVCYAQKGDFERADELRTEIKKWDIAYVGWFRHLDDKLLKSHSLDFI